MRHGKRGRILDRPRDARRALLRSLVVALFREERIKTTLAKAKEVRGKVERLITYAKEGGVAKRRLAARDIQDRALLSKLFDEIASRFKERAGGYTRIFHLGPRLGDAAPMAQIELLGAPSVVKTEETKGKAASKKKQARPAPRPQKPKAKKEEGAKPETKPEGGEEKPKRRGLKGLFGGGRKKPPGPEGESKE
jgi:large subunit ribosomal protein L17